MKPPRSRLKKSDILRGYRMFSRVIAEGRTLQKGALRCFFLATPGTGGFVRIGFAVNRGVRTAVERNRARRWMRETYRRNKEILVDPATSNARDVSVVFLLRMRGEPGRTKEFRRSVDQSMTDLLRELNHQLVKQS